MTPSEIIATVSALLAGEPDPAFDALRNGGYDNRYPVVLEACPRPILALEVEVEGKTMVCGQVSVPEDHDAPDGKKIPLAFVILKAKSAAPAPDPVIYLHGGPGGFVLQDIGTTGYIFDFARDRRDIVSFDQRGAGLSNTAVKCMNEFASEFMEFVKPGEDQFKEGGSLSKCLSELKSAGVDLQNYNTSQNARDVAAIVSSLGYGEYNVYGISYGTKLAQEVMRVAPDNIRSVVLDSISRVDNPAYDTNGVPVDQAIGWVVDLCAADQQCNAAYPDLEATVNAAAERLSKGDVMIMGTPGHEGFISALMEAGNKYRNGPFMAYLPKVFTDLANGETATAEKLLAGGFASKPTPQSITAPYKKLTAYDKAIAEAIVQNAQQMQMMTQTTTSLMAALADDLAGIGTISAEQLLDDELSELLYSLEADAVLALTQDYVLLSEREPNKADIRTFVETHVPPAFQPRILPLVEAMSDEDVEAFYHRASLDASRVTNVARMHFALGIYACQEDFPFNSLEGFENISTQYRFPLVDRATRESTVPLYAFCDMFEKFPRDGYHEPVVSDIPVLATAGMKDTQTNPDAAAMVVRTMSNSQAILYPEAGHGVTIFSKCATDIAEAFIEDPTAKVNVSCVEGLKPKFLLPDGSFSDG